MSIARYDLTEDCTTGKVDITPVPETMEGRYVSYDDYAALEAKCAAMAAENAGLKESRKNLAEFIHEELDADYPLNMNVETQATDAFLAEVRAQGVDSAVETITVHMNPRHLAVAEVLCMLRTHAEQLRKEVK